LQKKYQNIISGHTVDQTGYIFLNVHASTEDKTDNMRSSFYKEFNYWGVHPVARVSSNVNKPPNATMFDARFYCALTLHVSAPIGGHLQVLCDKIYSKVAMFMSTDPLSRHIIGKCRSLVSLYNIYNIKYKTVYLVSQYLA
jgi:hypothetical protein